MTTDKMDTFYVYVTVDVSRNFPRFVAKGDRFTMIAKKFFNPEIYEGHKNIMLLVEDGILKRNNTNMISYFLYTERGAELANDCIKLYLL